MSAKFSPMLSFPSIAMPSYRAKVSYCLITSLTFASKLRRSSFVHQFFKFPL